MNTSTAAREATRSPSPAASHAETVACHAAARARAQGADETTCALIHAETYAAAMRGQA